MKAINIKFIPIQQMRMKGGLGDYWETDNSWEFRIADTGNPYYNMAITQHELHEWLRAVIQDKIPEPLIQEYDEAHEDSDDPGFLPDCPIRKHHAEATSIEMLSIVLTGHFWPDYEARLDEMQKEVWGE